MEIKSVVSDRREFEMSKLIEHLVVSAFQYYHVRSKIVDAITKNASTSRKPLIATFDGGNPASTYGEKWVSTYRKIFPN